MTHDRTDFRCRILDELRGCGYQIVEQGSDVSDPFHWWVIASKDGYEIRIEERAGALVSP
jgi:hypothetical protein